MNDSRPQAMRKLIIAGTHAQYRDWLAKNNASPRAAVEINSEDDLFGRDPEDEIVLTGTYADNAAYQSPMYLWMVNMYRMALAS